MRVFIIDAFTSSRFAGNPAGVVLLDGDAEESWMQSVAAELRHSETAFVRPREDGSYDLRWFTPAAEIALCGHATLATAHALLGGGASGPFVFHTASGALTASIRDDVIELDFPAKPVEAVDAPAGLAAAIGMTLVGTYANGMDILAEVADESAVAAAQPDIAALLGVECRGVIVTATGDDGGDHDFVSRFFAPRVGVDEDPVTGSAHCALAPFWGKRLGRTEMTGVQLSPRGGRIGVAVRGDRVMLSGRAVTVLAGELAG